MARYSLNLPRDLKREAEDWAERQNVSLNQFIMWSVAEKVGELRQRLDDPAFPTITYRRGASGLPTPVIRGTGVRVQTVVIARERWSQTADEIAEGYGLAKQQVAEALSFYQAHQHEIDEAIKREEALSTEHV